ncbi:MAG: hypothetical protein ACO1QR_01525 [Chthoniobacteraceae bacterium]
MPPRTPPPPSHPIKLIGKALGGWTAGLLLLACAQSAAAQSEVRSSLAGERAAAARERVQSTDYHLRLGPAFFKMSAGLDFEYDDNVNRADDRLSGERGPQEDFFVRPRLRLTGSWQVTRLNRLSLQLGTGYEFSLNDARDSRTSPFTLAPDSQIGFDVFVGDFRINFHDRFSLENNPASQATVGRTGQYSRFRNAAGVSVLWDLNDIILSSGYDYVVERYTGGSMEWSDRNMHEVELGAAFLLSDTTQAGLQGRGIYSTFPNYAEQTQTMYSVGPFLEQRLTAYTKLMLAGGLVQNESDGQASTSFRRSDEGASSSSGFYWSALVSNRLNRWYTHSLSAGQERQLGLRSDYIDVTYLRYGAAWRVNSALTLKADAALEEYERLNREPREKLTQYRIGLGFRYRLRSNLSADVRYHYSSRDSNLEFHDYKRNQMTVGFTYSF